MSKQKKSTNNKNALNPNKFQRKSHWGTDKPSKHVKINGQIMQLWFGNVQSNVPSLAPLTRVNDGLLNIIGVIREGLIRPKLLDSTLSNILSGGQGRINAIPVFSARKGMIKPALLSLMMLGTSSAYAAELVTNGDFATGDLTNWTATTTDSGHTATYDASTDGAKLAVINIVGASEIKQSINLVAGTDYQITFDVENSVQVTNQGFLGNIKAEVIVDGQTYLLPPVAGTDSTTVSHSFSFTASTTGPTDLTFLLTTTTGTIPAEINFDNISVDLAPATPGGVSDNLALWLKADAGVSSTMIDVAGTTTSVFSGNIGQSFTATEDGSMTGFQINRVSGAVTADLTIYAGAGYGGAVLYTQAGIDLSATGDIDVVLDTPLPIVNGNQYTFTLVYTGDTTFAFDGDTYAGGMVHNAIFPFAFLDLQFKVFVAGDTPSVSIWADQSGNGLDAVQNTTAK